MRTSLQRLLLSCSLLAAAVTAQADTLKSDSEMRQLTDKVMTQLKALKAHPAVVL